MKSNSNIKPLSFFKVGDGSFQVNYNVAETLVENEICYCYDSIIVWNEPNYDNIVAEIIKEHFTSDFREAAIRKGITNPLDKDYVDFNNFVEQTKSLVKELLNNGVG